MKLSRGGRAGLATLIWIAIGVMLIYRGLVPHFSNIETTWGKALALVLGVIIGGAKGMFVLRKSAVRTAGFIQRRPEKDWFWFCLHPILYILIPVMIGFGLLLKHYFAGSNPGIVVAVYVGIGCALIMGSLGFRRHLDSA